MTWVREIELVRTPMIGNWDFATKPVLWPGEDPVSGVLDGRGDPNNPLVWIDFDVDRQPGEYLASGGGNSRHLFGVIDAGIMVEPVAENARDLVGQQVDLLESFYNAGSTSEILFRVPEAYCTELILWEDRWLRSDWICPFWRFEDLAQTEEAFLAGQSSNQKNIAQTAHGFAVGDWVGFNGTSWVKAQATAAGIRSRGVVSTVKDVDNFTITTGDVIKLSAHGLTLGDLFLSIATAGAAQSTEPTLGQLRQELGSAIDDDYVVVQLGEMVS